MAARSEQGGGSKHNTANAETHCQRDCLELTHSLSLSLSPAKAKCCLCFDLRVKVAASSSLANPLSTKLGARDCSNANAFPNNLRKRSELKAGEVSGRGHGPLRRQQTRKEAARTRARATGGVGEGGGRSGAQRDEWPSEGRFGCKWAFLLSLRQRSSLFEWVRSLAMFDQNVSGHMLAIQGRFVSTSP